MKHFAITSGDPNGIGLEVSAKALEKLGPQKGLRFILYRSSKGDHEQLKRLDKKFLRISVRSLSEAFDISKKNNRDPLLLDFVHEKPAPFWVEESALACTKHQLQGLITAPLSKTLIQSCGFKAKGHTEILQKVSKTKKVHMVFVGRHFSVLLATGHIPLSEVSQRLTSKELKTALERALQARKILPLSIRSKPVALLGLNPHAGESGLLGREETFIFKKALGGLRDVYGPISPDAAFLKSNWKRFSLYVACYHDQGLIPFKMIHGTESGYHLTFGLPFIRTSVDHGTAFDIYGKDRADGSSMLDAIRACMTLSR